MRNKTYFEWLEKCGDTWTEEYTAQLRQDFNWDTLVEEAKDNPQESYDCDGRMFGYAFLGTVFSLTPSGKYYTPWANSNASDNHAARDECWREALDKIAEEFGGWIENGEDDPCDIFFVVEIEEEQDDECCKIILQAVQLWTTERRER